MRAVYSRFVSDFSSRRTTRAIARTVLSLNVRRRGVLSEDAAQSSVGSPDGRSIKIILISVYSTPGGRRRMKAGSPVATLRSSSPVESFTGLQTSPVDRPGTPEMGGVMGDVMGGMMGGRIDE